MSIITLTQGDMQLRISPELGGSVMGLTHGGQHVLRHVPDDVSAVLDTASFPLVPFSGRIGDGRFVWDDETYSLPPNMPPEPHAIHGQGWQMPWAVTVHAHNTATLTLDYNGPDWPWTYQATQTFTVTDDALRVDLSVTNMSDTPMPAGLGWHPYFPRGDAHVSCNVAAVWLNNDAYLPDGASALSPQTDLRARRHVDSLVLDNAFTAGQPRHARIDWPVSGLSVDITASDTLGYWVVYIPEGADFFCVEPVSQAPDALNLPLPHTQTGLRILAPNETLVAWTRLQIRNE